VFWLLVIEFDDWEILQQITGRFNKGVVNYNICEWDEIGRARMDLKKSCDELE